MVSGQKVVKVFNHEEANLTKFRERNEALRKAGEGAQRYAATMVPAVVTISYINYAIVAVFGGLLALNGLADVGSLASYLVFVRQAAMPINQFTAQSNFLLAALAGAERVFQAMSQPPEVDEGTVRLARAEDGKGWDWLRADGTRTPLRGDVRFENVDFGYEEGQTILHDVSLYAKPGQKIAFVGSTGAGKTTITNLINRFYDVQKGRVVYDGIDVRDIRKDDLRRSLGIVLQDTHLFSGTIADNIRFGKLDATQEEVERAARIANADSFIRRLPQGLRYHGHCRRRQPLAGPAPAPGHRPRRRGGPARAHPRRGHLLHRHAHRGPHRKGHGRPHAGPHRLRHRPPPLHRAQRRRQSWCSTTAASSSAATTRSCSARRACTISSTTACLNSADGLRGRGEAPAPRFVAPASPETRALSRDRRKL